MAAGAELRIALEGDVVNAVAQNAGGRASHEGEGVEKGEGRVG